MSNFKDYTVDVLDGFSVGDKVWFKISDSGDAITYGEISRLVKHPKIGNFADIYDLNNYSLRTKALTALSKTKITKERKRKNA